jgi:hypothetical protein
VSVISPDEDLLKILFIRPFLPFLYSFFISPSIVQLAQDWPSIHPQLMLLCIHLIPIPANKNFNKAKASKTQSKHFAHFAYDRKEFELQQQLQALQQLQFTQHLQLSQVFISFFSIVLKLKINNTLNYNPF